MVSGDVAADDWRPAIARAEESIDSGRARVALERLVGISNGRA
jgi:anthranilate phosphoribosyltransferase